MRGFSKQVLLGKLMAFLLIIALIIPVTGLNAFAENENVTETDISSYSVNAAFKWFESGSSTILVDHLDAGTLETDQWDGVMMFQYPVEQAIAAGDFEIILHMGADFTGDLSISNASGFTITNLGSGQWKLVNSEAIPDDYVVTLEIKASLTGKIRTLNVAADGSMSFNNITLDYSAGADHGSLGPLSLKLQTVKDTYTVTKTAQKVEELPVPGLLSSNLPDLYSHTFVEWVITVTRDEKTRPVVSDYKLEDIIPGFNVGSGKGSIVSVRQGNTLLYSETDTTLKAPLTICNNADGQVVFSNLGTGVFKVIVKYPFVAPAQADQTVDNTAELSGRYNGAGAPELLDDDMAAAVKIWDSSEFGIGMEGNFYKLSKQSFYMLRGSEFRWPYASVIPKEVFAEDMGFGANITITKEMPGQRGSFSGEVDIEVYDDAMTYGGDLLNSDDLYISKIVLPKFSDATEVLVYTKSSYDDPSWSYRATYQNNNQNIVFSTQNYAYVKVVYRGVSEPDVKTLKVFYQAKEPFKETVKQTALAELVNHAGLDVLVSGTGELVETAISNPVNTQPYEQVNDHKIIRASDSQTVQEFIRFSYIINAPSITVDDYASRLNLSYNYTLYNSGCASGIDDLTMAVYLPENIFLDEDTAVGDILGTNTNGDVFTIAALQTELVEINGIIRQKVVISLDLNQKFRSYNEINLTLKYFTYDTETYRPGETIPHEAYVVVEGYPQLDRNHVMNFWSAAQNDRSGENSVTPDKAKIVRPEDESSQDIIYKQSRTDLIPDSASVAFTGVTNYVYAEDGTLVRDRDVYIGEVWTYQISAVIGKGTMKNVVLYDVLPYIDDVHYGNQKDRNSSYTSQLLDIDLSAIPQERRPVIYYSSKVDPVSDLTSSDWSLTKPEDVRAIAFDFGEILFEADDEILNHASIDITVRTDADPGLTGKECFHSVYAEYVVKRANDAYVGVPARDTNSVRVVLKSSPVVAGNTLFYDDNENGVYDSSEVGAADRKVKLINASDGSTVAERMTDANGNYLFQIFEEGTYYVVFEKDDDEVFTIYNGSDTNIVYSNISGVSGNTGRTPDFEVVLEDLVNGKEDMTHNAGITSAGSEESTDSDPNESDSGDTEESGDTDDSEDSKDTSESKDDEKSSETDSSEETGKTEATKVTQNTSKSSGGSGKGSSSGVRTGDQSAVWLALIFLIVSAAGMIIFTFGKIKNKKIK